MTTSHTSFPLNLTLRTMARMAALAMMCCGSFVQAQTSGTWTSAAGGTWTSGVNWLGGNVASGGGNADFSQLNITTDPTVVHLDASETISNLFFGDLNTNTAAGWLLDDNNSVGANILTLSGTPSIITVNALGSGKALKLGPILAGTTGLTKNGNGILVLTNAETLTGGVTVSGGNLTLDFTGGATTAILPSQSLVMGSGALNITGSASTPNVQSFTSTVFTNGLASINGSGTILPELDFGALGASRLAGAGVVLNGPATITNIDGVTVTPATSTNTTTTAGSAASTASLGFIQAGGDNTANAFGYMTVGLYDWASTSLADGTAGASPYTIVGGSQVAGFYAPFANTGSGTIGAQVNGATPVFAGPSGIGIQRVNFDITNNTAVAGYAASRLVIGSLRFNTPLPINLWFGWGQGTGGGNPVNCGGFLVTPNVGANNITIDNHAKSGINGSTGNPMTIVWQNNTLGQLIFNQSLGGNGPPTFQAQMIQGNGYEQNGLGTASFLGVNNILNGIFLNGGVLEIAQNVCLGGVAGGAVQGVPNLPVHLNGGTLLGNYTGNLDDGTNSGIGAHPIVVRIKGGGLAATAGNTFTVDGIITNSPDSTGGLVIGIPASSANGNTLGQVPGTGTGTANAAVNATGTVVINNTGNAYAGGTTLASGILQLTVNNLAVLGTGGLALNGGTFQWNGVTTDISSRTVTLASSGGTLDVNGNNVILASAIGNSGTGALTVKSTTPGGKLTLSGANTYTGGTTVNANTTLLVNGSTSSGNVSVSGTLGGTGTISGGGNVVFNSGAQASLTAGSPLTVSGSVTLNGNTVTVLGSSLTSAGSPYTLLNASGGITGSSTVISSPGGTAIAAGYVGSVSISGSLVILTVTAVPSATWNNANGTGNWSDPLNWSATFGTPPPSGAQSTAIFGTGSTPVNLDVNETVGTVAFNSSSIPYVISGANILTLDSSGSGAAITMASGTANAAISTAVSLKDNLTATVAGGDTLTLANVISNTTGAKTLTVNGAGTVALSGNNTYGPASGSTGTILSGGGTLQVGHNNALGAGDVSAAGSTIKAGAAGLTVANKIALGAGTTTVDNNGNNLTFSGVVSSVGTLAKSGAGVLTLGNANNTYSGGTTINGDFVAITGDGISGGSAANLGVVPNSIAAANIVLNGGGLLDNTSLTLHTNRGITLTGQGLLDAANGVNFTVGGIVAGAGNGILVNGGAGHAGTVILNAANTFSGTTTVSNGVLQLGNALGLQNSTLNLMRGTLDFGSQTAATIGGLSGTNTLNLTNASAAAVALTIGNNDVSATSPGFVGGSGSVRKLGGGSITIGSGLIGGASYSGNTTVDVGTLTLGGVGNMSTAGNLDISGVGLANAIVADNAVAAFAGSIFLGDGNSQPFAATLTVKNNAKLSAASLDFGHALGRVAVGSFVTVQDNASLTISNSFDINHPFSSQAENDVLNLNGGTTTVGYFLATSASAAHQSTINLNGGMLVAGTADATSGFTFLPAYTGLTVNVTNTVPAIINTAGFTNTIAAALVNTNVNPDGGLVKLGTGTLNLLGNNTYKGLTTVSNGALHISTAVQSATESFVVKDGKTFGVINNVSSGQSALIVNLTLGQSSGPTALVFANVADTTVPVINASGTVTLNGNCAIRIADAVNLVAGNKYPLIQYAGSIVTNSGAGFSLSLPPGIAATLTNDASISTISLIVAQPSFSFSSVAVSGSDLVLNATGGTPSGSVTVLTSTNVALPLLKWTPVTTGNFDGSGNFNYTVTGALTSGLPQQFYILRMP